MKKKEEIIKRIMCLLCFTDRCVLETSVIDGIIRSLKERENQRQAIIEWLKWKEYYNSFSDKEKRIMETPITNHTNNDIVYYYHDYECIEPLLWSIGLANKLSNYDDYIIKDLHPPVKIGPNHSLQSIVNCCKDNPETNVEKYKEIAMLWYWRCLEARNGSSKNVNFRNAIIDVFGEDCFSLLENYKGFNPSKGDFIVKGKTVSELSNIEVAKLEIIAERRFYAFEWLFSDDDWDNVDLVC